MPLSSRLVGLPAALAHQIRKKTLYVILLVGLIQGLLYVFLLPPWWHFDEPGHFEFAWQIVHFDHWPRFNEVDEAMRRELAPSLMKYRIYELLGYQPDLTSDEPVYIGYAPQTTNYPLYYLVASLPLRILGRTSFVVQDIAMRLMSLGMFLLTLWVAWKALGEILPEGHPLQWMTTLFLALLPGFADTMTAVNDDVGAVLGYSVFVWTSLRLLQRGPSLSRFAAFAAGLALCYWTKNTAWPAIALAPIVLLFSIFRNKWQGIAWAVMVFAFIGGLFFSFRRDDPALWYRAETQTQSIRTSTTDGPLGKFAFSLHYNQRQSPSVGQFLSISQVTPLRRKTVTLGAWIWADQPTKIQLPGLRFTLHGTSGNAGIAQLFNQIDKSTLQKLAEGTCSACILEIKDTFTQNTVTDANPTATSPAQTAMLTTSPTFYSATFVIPSDAESGWLELIPFPSGETGTADGASDVTIYFDGVVLAKGERQGAPQFDSYLGRSGKWGGHSFENLARNASAESAWFRLSPGAEQIMEKVFTAGNPGVLSASVQDWRGTGQYYRGIVANLFESFWAKTGINRIILLGGPLSYKILQWITAIGLIGALALILRRARDLPWAVVIFLFLALASIWGLTVARGGIELLKSYGVLPWARYAFPSVIPTALLLCAGWWEAGRWLERWFGFSPRRQAQLFIAFLIGLDILAMVSIARYFYWQSGQEYLILLLSIVLAVFGGVNLLDEKKPPLPEDNGNQA